MTEDVAKAITLTGSDADGTALTYYADGLPPGLTISSNLGVIAGTLLMLTPEPGPTLTSSR